jgi:hypothetical protein
MNIYSPEPPIHLLTISPGSTHMSLQTQRRQNGYKGSSVSTIYSPLPWSIMNKGGMLNGSCCAMLCDGREDGTGR